MNIRYLSYIRSVEWQHKRQVVLKRDGFRCQTCWAIDDLEVHHIVYTWLFYEEFSDYETLITLCGECHEAITNRMRRTRYRQRRLKLANHRRVSSIVEIERKSTTLILVDIVRYLPLPAERITRHGVSLPAVSNYRRSTPDRP